MKQLSKTCKRPHVHCTTPKPRWKPQWTQKLNASCVMTLLQSAKNFTFKNASVVRSALNKTELTNLERIEKHTRVAANKASVREMAERVIDALRVPCILNACIAGVPKLCLLPTS